MCILQLFSRLPYPTTEVKKENTAFRGIIGTVFHTSWSETIHALLDLISFPIDHLSLKDCEEVI